ncbi:aldehyde dehydrogenase family protein [Nonomuraea angiospora]|uniref:aldehyde dehydrogenase family protein n=1 Tax=Nonomuraea angiospora TaxID=46172 RepID=UPI003EB901F6
MTAAAEIPSTSVLDRRRGDRGASRHRHGLHQRRPGLRCAAADAGAGVAAGGGGRARGGRRGGVRRRLRTGQVDVNGAGWNALAPFGGYKQSGNGREFGRHGLEEHLETESIQS